MKKRCSRMCLLSAVLGLVTGAILLSGCGKSTPMQVLQNRYKLSDAEAAQWGRLHVDEAESLSVRIWGHIGRGEFDQARLMIKRFDDYHLDAVFDNRIKELWANVITRPAAEFLKEPQLQLLGEGKTVGFTTWGELLSSGFERAVLANDSITVYFVFKGYWQAHAMPVYAAVACGDFGTEEPQWRPLAHLVFSLDAAEETVKTFGKAQYARNIDEFVTYLRTRTFGSLKTENP